MLRIAIRFRGFDDRGVLAPRRGTLMAALTALIILVFLMPVTNAAVQACEDHAYVRPILDPLPEALTGMRVEIHKTMGPQVVIANPTGRILEVLDDANTPFVRIGPRGVEANVAAKAWYETYSPGAVAPASATVGAPPRWKRAATDATFGWFDRRLDAKLVSLPIEVIERKECTDLGRWSVPLRVDGEPAALSGTFRYEPPPAGMFVARMITPSEVAPGVRVRLLPGRAAGFLIQNSSSSALQILGVGGEPFLLIGPDGVDANLQSPTWWESARSSSGRPASVSRLPLPDWQRVAAAGRFSWIDPRLQAPTEGATRGPISWRIPMVLDGRPLVVAGETRWTQLSTRD